MDPGLQSALNLQDVRDVVSIPAPLLCSTRLNKHTQGFGEANREMKAATITVCSIRLSPRIWPSVGKCTRHPIQSAVGVNDDPYGTARRCHLLEDDPPHEVARYLECTNAVT